MSQPQKQLAHEQDAFLDAPKALYYGSTSPPNSVIKSVSFLLQGLLVET